MPAGKRQSMNDISKPITTVRPTREQAMDAVRTLIRWAGDNPQRSGLSPLVWIPLCFAMLVIGLAAGLMAPRYLGTIFAGANTAPYTLSLSVSQDGDSLTVHWNPDAP